VVLASELRASCLLGKLSLDPLCQPSDHYFNLALSDYFILRAGDAAQWESREREEEKKRRERRGTGENREKRKPNSVLITLPSEVRPESEKNRRYKVQKRKTISFNR
jgi:hypothetical protein